MLRAILFNLAFYPYTLLCTVLWSPMLLLPEQYGRKILTIWASGSRLLLHYLAGVKSEIRGKEHLIDGGAIIASKHQSTWETFALMPEVHHPVYIMKEELKRIPLFGWYAMKYQMIFVNRSKGSKALLQMSKDAKREIARGRHLIIFPEGTRKMAGAETYYKNGVAQIYRMMKCPCVPVALNSGLFWPRRKLRRYPGTIVAEFLEPIPPGLPQEEFLALLEERIEEATERLMAEALASDNPPPLTEALKAREQSKTPA